MTTDPNDIRAGITEAAERRTKSEQERADAMADLAAWVRLGHKIVPAAEMARLSGLSRKTIYELLDPSLNRRNPQ